MLIIPTLALAEENKGCGGTVRSSRYHENYEGWRRLIPTHAKLQYAGGMGLMSAGMGWDYGVDNQWETDVLVGFLPKNYLDRFHMTFTLRQNYIPWSIDYSSRFAVEPLACGVYANIITGDNFWIKEPGHYPGDRSYYKFSSRLRLHLCAGQRVKLTSRILPSLQALWLYYEFSINDLMLISKFNNRTLKLSDVVYFSIGVKAQLFGK